MKKTSKIFGALALSAALAMSAVPAFAVTASDAVAGDQKAFGDGQNDTTLNAGDTDVYVLAEVTQINATIPLSVTVVADIQGGGLKYSPTGDGSSGYRIENRTQLPIKVVDVTAAQGTNDKWTYEESAITDVTNYGGGDKWGRINLTLATGTDVIAAATASGTAVATTATALGWSVPAGTQAEGDDEVTPGVLGIKVGGTTSYINSDEEISTATAGDEAVTLTYTIAIDNQTGTTTDEG